jgi:hypothetical protein
MNAGGCADVVGIAAIDVDPVRPDHIKNMSVKLVSGDPMPDDVPDTARQRTQSSR